MIDMAIWCRATDVRFEETDRQTDLGRQSWAWRRQPARSTDKY